jgi:hypothetical protein
MEGFASSYTDIVGGWLVEGGPSVDLANTFFLPRWVWEVEVLLLSFVLDTSSGGGGDCLFLLTFPNSRPTLEHKQSTYEYDNKTNTTVCPIIGGPSRTLIFRGLE